MENISFSMILAVDEKNGIGKSGDLAWNLPSDLKHFKKITTQTHDLAKMNAVIMGKNTWKSLPVKFRPLPDRINCILSSDLEKDNIGSSIDNFVLYFSSLEHCLSELEGKENVENIFVIGGGQLYNYALKSDLLEKIYITKVKGDFDCDVHFDGVPKSFVLESYTDYETENGIEYSFQVYKNIKFLYQ
ncbi:MAG: dihydrofolate reductase [Candidatus Gracilibacteria bacterium]|nr:dihydrofolate reductase [Candidatus Gracilibacteria bacterium]